ncbi:oligosaccharide flippase family protein [candidate division KSB1 bacterium]|nr:oligosaccharide flippase family protein [candidate division KSB1 bacterium]
MPNAIALETAHGVVQVHHRITAQIYGPECRLSLPMISAPKLSHAVAWNHLTKVSGYGLDFLLSIVLARALGSRLFGLYSELYNFIFIFSLFSLMGMDTSVNVYLPEYKADARRLAGFVKKALSRLLWTTLAVALVIVLIKSQLAKVVQSDEISFLLEAAVVFLIFYNLQVFMQAVLTSFFYTRFLFLANTLLKTLLIVVALFVLGNQGTLRQLILVFGLVYSATVLVYLIKIGPVVFGRSVPVDLKAFYRFGYKAWSINFVNYFLGRYSDILLLGMLGAGKDQIGFYTIAFTLTMALSYVFTAGLTGVLLTAFSAMYIQGNTTAIKESWRAICQFMIFLCVPVFGYAVLHAKTILPLIYSAEYEPAVLLFQLFALFNIGVVLLGSGLNSTVLYAIRQENRVLRFRLVCGLSNVGLNLFLIPHYGAMGAIIATGISLILTVLLEFRSLVGLLGIRFPGRFTTMVIFCSLVALLISSYLSTETLFGLVINLGVFAILLITLLFWLKPFSRLQIEILYKMNRSLARIISLFAR